MKKFAGPIIRRYSTALTEAAVESGSLRDIAQQARSFAALLTPDVAEALDGVSYPASFRNELLDDIFKAISAHDVLRKTVHAALEYKRQRFLKGILEEFLKKADTLLGVLRAEVVSSAPLSASEVDTLRASLVQATQKEVVLTPSVDPAVMAGLVLKIGNTVVDASLRTRLTALRESLSQGV